ncbi:hypothetical protein JZ751_003516 [Albula glossodonta]|uniref:Protein Wnt n=1 Tax=Albula glossodonta TaxID=121402 RepID=A0A8T2N627_9TELE|nr:hypothetical protein JZ751_003516 [Albula glossodonta]
MNVLPTGICFYISVVVCWFTSRVDASWWYMGTIGSQVMCDNVPGLVNKQRQLCRQHPKMMQAIGAGIKDWIEECQYQFRNHRWNCSTMARDHTVFGRILLRSSREAAFLYAISSAGVVHTLTRACSQGELESCSCDPEKKGTSRDSKGTFDWGGCMKRFMNLECKCHGMSGSCTVRTCWLAMADFRHTGEYLRRRYNGAVQVVQLSESSGKDCGMEVEKLQTSTCRAAERPGDDISARGPGVPQPTHILSEGSVGTGGRVCNRTSRGVDSCEVMCCGRGYDTSRVSRTTKCECKFHWCCAVRCRDCHEVVDVHTCKAQDGTTWLGQM